MKINKRQFNRWLRALYEQELPQSQRRLQNQDGYCCLGVGCKVLIPKKKYRLADGCFLYGNYPDAQNDAPDWLKDINDDFYKKTDKFTLALLNDDKGFTHPEIAMLLDLVYNYKILENEN